MKRQIGSAGECLKALPARFPQPIVGRVEVPSFLSGKLLLAMPGMADPRFERAVIAMCVHDENGAIGIGIGHKRAGISFRGLLRQLEIEPGDAPDCAVHHGGPVEPGRSTCSGRSPKAAAHRSGSRRLAMPAGARGSWMRK
jgi:putative AlgH/UPF0301 family transcriptional regulator